MVPWGLTLKGHINVTQILMACISEMEQDSHVVTIGHVQEVVHGGSNGAMGFDLG